MEYILFAATYLLLVLVLYFRSTCWPHSHLSASQVMGVVGFFYGERFAEIFTEIHKRLACQNSCTT